MNHLQTIMLVALPAAITVAATGGNPGSYAFSLSSGDFAVSLSQGHPGIRIHNPAAGESALLWIPGGRSGPLAAIFEPSHLENVAVDQQRHAATLRGSLDWAAYSMTVEADPTEPGFIRLTLDLTPKQDVPADRVVLAGAHAELVAVDAQGAPMGLAATFYYETEVPAPVKIWSWRDDLNQSVFFGSREVLNASVLYTTDFTSLNPYFIDSKTKMFPRYEAFDNHENIVQQAPGALGTSPDPPFEFGLVIPQPQGTLHQGKTYRVSSAMLQLQAGVPAVTDTAAVAKRFLKGYGNVFRHVGKPETRFHDWLGMNFKLIDEMGRRKDAGYAKWTLTEPNFQLLSHREFFDTFAPKEWFTGYEAKALEHLRLLCGPDYVNDRGSKGIIGWYRDREGAAKADFWQGYLWPSFMVNQYVYDHGLDTFKAYVLQAVHVLLDTGRALDYTFAVFVDVNKGENVESGYDMDYGAAGLYAALMLQYYRFTGDETTLEEATKATQKLNQFGFASGFETNVTALTAVTMLELYKLTGKELFLDGFYIQLAVILKHTWLFNPQYERFSGRDIFALTSCRANLSYANSAEEGMLIRYLRKSLALAENDLEAGVAGLIAEVLRYKAHTCTDGLPVYHQDKSRIHQGQPASWDKINVDGYFPMEPFGYVRDGHKLGYLNECRYGTNMLAEPALMQFHPLVGKSLFYSEGPVRFASKGAAEWTFRLLGADHPGRVGLIDGGPFAITAATGEISLSKDLFESGPVVGFWAEPGVDYTISRE